MNVDDPIVQVICDEGVVSRKLSEVKSLCVNIKGSYYLKTSSHLVKILTISGKYRFYRKKSPLIYYCPETHNYHLKSESIRTATGEYVPKSSQSVKEIKGLFYHKSFCVQIKNEWYLKGGEDIVRDYAGNYQLKQDCEILTHPKVGDNVWALKSQIAITAHGFSCPKSKTVDLLNPITKLKGVYYIADPENKNTLEYISGFKDVTNPQIDRYIFGKAIRVVNAIDYFQQIDFSGGFDDTKKGIVFTPDVPYFEEIISNIIVVRYKHKLLDIKERLNERFSDLDETENKCSVFKIINAPFPGKQNIYKSSEFNTPILGRAIKKTGGLNYTFGAEFETSQGLLATRLIEKLGLHCVGDRSVGAGEYVTPVLQGDKGISRLSEIASILSKHTLIDDRCSTHFHIKIPGYSFNRKDLINAIKLGSLIEEELYKSLPPSRHPTLYHCHSIRRWGDINEDNYKVYMGAYIFGQKEWWLEPTELGAHEVTPLFKFENYELGEERNRNTPIQPWQDGRYKWLNLIPAYSKKGIGTIEFRIFPPSTNFKKIYSYLMLCMAFVHVVVSHPTSIQKGITLNDIFKLSFKGELAESLSQFYEDRKSLFARSSIYPSIEKYKLSFLNQ